MFSSKEKSLNNEITADEQKTPPEKASKSFKIKQALFQKPETKGKEENVTKHEYFSAHQCYLTPEAANVHQIECNPLIKYCLYFTAVNFKDIRAKNLFRSYSALCDERYRQFKSFPFAIHPYSRLRIWFEGFVMLSLIASQIALAVKFSQKNPTNETSYVLLHIFDVIYEVNIILNFFTGYVAGSTCQYVVLECRKIVWKYLTTWFIVDAASTLSFLPGYFFMDNISLYMVLISMKLLQIITMMRYLKHLMVVARIGIFGKTVLEIFVLLMSYLTWNVFLQFAVEFMKMDNFNPNKPDNCSWISKAHLWNGTTALRFTYAFDRAVAMLRKNSNVNLVEEKGCFENFFLVAWLVAKTIMYHSAFLYMVSLVGEESAKAKYFIMTNQVETFMNQRRFPPRIKEKILKFYAIRFQSQFFAEARMLNCVTGQLREDIIMHTGRQLVGELEFLKQLPRALLLQIGMKLKIVIFIAGDIIFKINTVGDCLYFIDKGTVAIYSESGNEICHLEDGDYFGEIALVMKHRIRTASVVAVTNCELFKLDKEDFDASIACYPTVYEKIKKVAISRYERTCVLDEHHKAELKIAENHASKNNTAEL